MTVKVRRVSIESQVGGDVVRVTGATNSPLFAFAVSQAGVKEPYIEFNLPLSLAYALTEAVDDVFIQLNLPTEEKDE